MLRFLRLALAIACPLLNVNYGPGAEQERAGAAVIRSADFPNLQAALDAIPTTGGELRLDPGTVEIDRPLRLHRSDVRIIGAGPSTHIINKNQEGEPAWLVTPSAEEMERNSKADLWRVQFQDLRITGNPKSGNGIEARKVNELHLQGITVSYHGGEGVAMIDCYEDPRIVACLFTYNKRCGVLLDNCHDIVVSANQFEENKDALRCTNSFNLCMNGNNLDDHLRHGVIIENTYGSVLSGNMIEECKGTAIILDRDCYGITISANVIAHHLQGGIDLKDAWGCSISANTLVLVHEFGVRAGGSSGRLTITGNSFSNSEIGGKLKRPLKASQPLSRDAGSGIVLDATQDIVISGNQFSGLDTPAVLTSNACERIVLHGNLSTDCGRLAKAESPWYDMRGSRNSEATGNLPKAQVAQ